MATKVLITVHDEEVAPRFDLTTEVVIAVLGGDGSLVEERSVVLPRASSEELCRLILNEGIHLVVCGGIEEEYFQYLTWKKIQVLDSVIGSREDVLASLKRGTLKSGAILVGQNRSLSDAG